MTENSQRNSPLHRFMILAIILLLLGLAVLTAGILPRDHGTLRISAQGPDTLVILRDRTVLLKNVQWPGKPLIQSIQVGGWTTSAHSPNPTLLVGSPGYVYINYRGRGTTEVTIGTETITFTDRGRSILVNGSPTPLPAGGLLEIAPKHQDHTGSRSAS